jgi:alkyldihydroxyacetonephosphate synthase
MASAMLEVGLPAPVDPPRVEDLRLPAARVRLPEAQAERLGASVDAGVRAAHTYGKAYRDVARALAGDVGAAPDVVLFPSDEAGVREALELCAERGFAAIPYGGGSSVTGGVEARGLRERFPGVVTIDLTRMARVLEIDRTSLAARVEAGILGPALEAALRREGLTLRHFPQSFEFSTLGGWLATRAAGHFATLETRIDEQTESLRLLTPAGPLETRRLPSSGAGPDPKRLVLGSEGAFGVITEAWIRVRPRPDARASADVFFADFLAGARAARAIAQAGLHPSNCRLLDPTEAMLSGACLDGRAVLLLAFEASGHDPAGLLARAIEIAREAGGEPGKTRTKASAGPSEKDGASERWKRLFLDAPYLRDHLARHGLIVETFETACTWDRLEGLVSEVARAVAEAARRECGRAVTGCRLTHVYPDGAAPYFTVVAPGRRGDEVRQWDAIKAASVEAILAAGGTVTHHHAVGRDHGAGYIAEQSTLFDEVLRNAKHSLDPRGVMNPGALLPLPPSPEGRP